MRLCHFRLSRAAWAVRATWTTIRWSVICRDARVTTLYEGTSHILKLIIGRAETGIDALQPVVVEREPVTA